MSNTTILFIIILMPYLAHYSNFENMIKKDLKDAVTIEKRSYGTTTDGELVDQFILKNKGGIEVRENKQYRKLVNY